ncbi:hypothetical protein V8O11_22220 [Erwinia aphidicola]|uniref:hypothetical protein n=1 Tax=Erwinia aphidicola TaxID=68334 RepID=UPI00300CCEE1
MSKVSLSCETCRHFKDAYLAPGCARTKVIKVIPARVYKEERVESFTDCHKERQRDFPGCGPLARHWEPNWWERNHAPAKMAVIVVLVTLTYFLFR